jgi:aminopeptidase YwaD
MREMGVQKIERGLTGSAEKVLDRTGAWISRFGGRLAGSAACRRSAEAIQAALEQACGDAHIEPFLTHPAAFARFYRIDIVLYVIGLGLLFFRQPLAAALVLVFMFIGAGLEFGWYVELYDRLYPLESCSNVSAVLQPRGPALRQLILSAHHDSAAELSFLKGSQKLYALKIFLPDLFRATAMTFAVIWTVWQAVSGQAPGFTPLVLAFLVLGFSSVVTKFNLFGKEAVPGAGDNLVAVAMLVELAQRFADPLIPGKSLLEHTRLIFVSFDAEESGLRGSRAWAKAHHAEVSALPTTALNIDSIYSARDVQFLVTDLNSHVRLDAALADHCIQIAAAHGCQAKRAYMRFGGGATDAVELTRAGAHATTMIAMPAGIVRDGLVYHTMKDTVDAIQPAAVEACLAVAEGLALALDAEQENPTRQDGVPLSRSTRARYTG